MELTRLSAAALAEKIHSREVSAVEAAQAHLDRIAAVDGTVHAFLHVAGEAALESASLVDAALDDVHAEDVRPGVAERGGDRPEAARLVRQDHPEQE